MQKKSKIILAIMVTVLIIGGFLLAFTQILPFLIDRESNRMQREEIIDNQEYLPPKLPESESDTPTNQPTEAETIPNRTESETTDTQPANNPNTSPTNSTSTSTQTTQKENTAKPTEDTQPKDTTADTTWNRGTYEEYEPAYGI